MRGPTVPEGYGETVFLSKAQIRYNELVETALQNLIKARNEDPTHANRQESLDAYNLEIEQARLETGAKEFVLVAG
jgi:hypothetical protein